MLSKKMFPACAVPLLCCSFSVRAARWQYGGATPNAVESVDYGRTGRVVIGDGAGKAWRWAGASGIGFRPAAAMPEKEDSKALEAGKIAAGTAWWEIVFRFSKPISRFRFTTSYCAGVDLHGGDVYIQYAVGEAGKYREIWRYGRNSPGYRKDKPIPPHRLDWVAFGSAEHVRLLKLRFTVEGFIGRMAFHANEDDGGVLEYTTKLLPIEETAEIILLPNHAAVGGTYYVDTPPRAFIKLGPNPPKDLRPVLLARDRGRGRGAGKCPVQRLGAKFVADLPALQAGAYELRLTLPGKAKPVRTARLALIRPARHLTWRQTLHSPFGVVGIGNHAYRVGSAPPIDGPALGQMLGVHQARGGIGSWVGVCKKAGAFGWNEKRLERQARDSLEFGIVYRGCLAWTPRWAVDMERVKKGGGSFIHYPPKSEFLPDYAEFCRQATTKVKDVFAPEFELWNEPNNEPYGSWKGTFDEFVTLCRTAADAVHSVNPQARMILGTTGDADAGYIARLFKAGLAEKFQIVDIHPYRHSDRGPEDGLLVDIRRLKRVIHLFGRKQAIIFSEIGWPTYTMGNHGMYAKVTQFQQACYFSRTLLISLAAGVERVHFHILTDFGNDPANPEHNFGIIDKDGYPKLSLSALSTTHRHLERSEFQGVVKGYPDYHHVWVWKTPWVRDATLLAVWCDTHNGSIAPRWIDLPGAPILAEDLWGGPAPADRLRKAAGRWQALPGEDPLFVYLPASSDLDIAPLPTAMRPWHLRRLPKRTVAAPRDTRGVVVDGDVSEWKSWPGVIGEHSGDSTAGMGYAGVEEGVGQKAESAVMFSVAYNDEGLLLAVRVADETPMENDFDHFWVWRGDHARVNIATVSSRKFPYISPRHFQIDLAPVTKGHGPAQAVQTCPKTIGGVKQGELVPGAKVAGRKAPGGWTLEALIPWSYLKARPASGTTWDFDVSAGGHTWNGGPNDWNNPLLWGEVVFHDAP